MSDLSVKTYAPCYNIDRKTGKGSYGTYDYSRLLEQQARLAKQEPDIGTYKLTDRELRQLAEKYDPSGMSEKEYESLIQDLVKKGVLGQSETCDIGLNRVVLRRGARAVRAGPGGEQSARRRRGRSALGGYSAKEMRRRSD